MRRATCPYRAPILAALVHGKWLAEAKLNEQTRATSPCWLPGLMADEGAIERRSVKARVEYRLTPVSNQPELFEMQASA